MKSKWSVTCVTLVALTGASCRGAMNAATHELGDDFFVFLILNVCKGYIADFFTYFPWLADALIIALALIFAFGVTLKESRYKNLYRSALVIAFLCLGVGASLVSRDLLEKRRIKKEQAAGSVPPQSTSKEVRPLSAAQIEKMNEKFTKLEKALCPNCAGTGKLTRPPILNEKLKCPVCSGTGRIQ